MKFLDFCFVYIIIFEMYALCMLKNRTFKTFWKILKIEGPYHLCMIAAEGDVFERILRIPLL